MDQQQTKPQQIQIKAQDEDLKGKYSNLMQITHTQEEFVLDFFLVIPPQGTLASRVILSPGHLKRMIKALCLALICSIAYNLNQRYPYLGTNRV